MCLYLYGLQHAWAAEQASMAGVCAIYRLSTMHYARGRTRPLVHDCLTELVHDLHVRGTMYALLFVALHASMVSESLVRVLWSRARLPCIVMSKQDYWETRHSTQQ